MLHVLPHVGRLNRAADIMEIPMVEQDKLIVSQLITQLEKITNDHEARIRFLERIIGFGIGGLAVVKFLFDTLSKQ